MSECDCDPYQNQVCDICLGVVGLGSLDEVDTINPEHYRSHPSGIEMTDVAEHMTFCCGNVIKYVWRAGLKDSKLEDLQKARWYLNREIERLHEEARCLRENQHPSTIKSTMPRPKPS